MKIKHLERLTSSSYIGGKGLPCVVRVMKSAPGNKTIAMHDHEFSEIAIVASGRLTHLHEGGTVRLTAGDFFAIHPGTRHGYADLDPGTEVYNILLNRETGLPGVSINGNAMLREIHSGRASENRPKVLGRLSPTDRKCAIRLMDEIRRCEKRPDARLNHPFCAALFTAVLFLLSRSMDSGGRRTDALPIPDIARETAYIRSNLTRRIGMQELCSISGRSPSTLYRMFMQKFGMGPGKFALETRLTHAESLLATTGMNLSAIAEQSGFGDASHLSKAFKASRGRPPGAQR